MKKMIAILLSTLIFISVFSAPAYADALTYEDLKKASSEMFSNSSDDQVLAVLALSLVELINRGIYEEAAVKAAIEVLDGTKSIDLSNQTEFSFGQGTFVVGVDLKAGTYDITCEVTSDTSYSDSIGSLGDIYSGLGLDEYADMFDALGGLADSVDSMSVEIKNSHGYLEKYIDLKVGETARIILEDGMYLEISNGQAKLQFIR